MHRSPRAPARPVAGRAFLLLVGLCAALGLAGPAMGQPPDPPNETPPRSGSEATPGSGSPSEAGGEPGESGSQGATRRAAALEALLDGELGPEVDPDPLLELDAETLALAKLPWEPEAIRREGDGGAADPDAAETAEGRAALRRAIARMLATDPELLAGRVETQRERHRAFLRERERASDTAAQDEALRRQATLLAQLLDGELSPEIDPHDLQRIDLLALARLVARAREGAPNPDQQAVELGSPAADPSSPARNAPPDATAPLPDGAAQLRRWLDADAETRAAAIARHLERRTPDQAEPESAGVEPSRDDAAEDARRAARLREEALDEAARARSEVERAIAEERARLRGIEGELASFTGELDALDAAEPTRREWLLAFRRHLRELKAARWQSGFDPAEADLRYAEIVEHLAVTRADFRRLLERARDPTAGLPELGPADLSLFEGPGGASLRTLREELSERRRALAKRAEQEVDKALQSTRDDTIALNELRLDLLTITSPAHRAAVTGLGPAGVAQAGRELDQIALELNYQALALPQLLARLRKDATVAPVPVVLALLKLGLVLLVFRWWRRRAEATLERARERWSEARPQTGLTRVVTALLWYLSKIRGPLEWLALGVLIVSLIDPRYLPEVSVARLVLLWTLGGATAIRLVDAAISRDDLRSDRPLELAELRAGSVRVSGRILIAIGLALSVARDLVGVGAIYNWLSGAAWLALVPLVGVLVYWWKPTIYARFRLESHEEGFRRWVLDQESSWFAYPVALLGGVVLLAKQLARAAIRQASAIEATRRFLAYLFRREVAKRAEGIERTEVAPLPPASLERLALSEVLIDDYAREQLERLASAAEGHSASLSVVIGAHGGGKSAFLRRLAGMIESPVFTIALRRDARHTLVTQLRRALSEAGLDPGASGPQAGRRTIVLVDDVHLCLQPSVGGMAQLDHFVDFAREQAASLSWIFTVSSPAWQYISRARGDTLFLDQIVRLPPWTEQQLRDLAMARAEDAGIDPSFEDLVVPRQFDDREYDEAERTRVGYFRILWDSAGGNPAVAMHFWQRSLHLGADGEPHVRLFVDPSPRDLERVNFNALFVLRSILQMEWASPEQIIECTRLGRADVLEALRFCRSRGYLETHEGQHRIALAWHQPIVRMLGRQHLLVAA